MPAAPAAAPADPAVLAFESDLEGTFAKMDAYADSAATNSSPSQALTRFSMAISTISTQQAVMRSFAEKHFEKEGSDALLFREVPKWIKYDRISGYRYRIITSIEDPADAFESFSAHVESIGFPGASGWADSIGDVAIHYLGRNWAVFSKVYPFAEQADARTAHSDVLLLGSTQHVMVTPMCAYRIGTGGLQQKDTTVDCLTCDGALGKPKTLSVAKLPSAVTNRLYLTWGHEASDFASEVQAHRFDLSALLEERTHETMAHKAGKFLSGLAAKFANAGATRVDEHWVRYPAAPLVPSYYAQLLATASGMTDEERMARELIEPRATPRGGASESVIDIELKA